MDFVKIRIAESTAGIVYRIIVDDETAIDSIDIVKEGISPGSYLYNTSTMQVKMLNLAGE